jgi:hypothetical protein
MKNLPENHLKMMRFFDFALELPYNSQLENESTYQKSMHINYTHIPKSVQDRLEDEMKTNFPLDLKDIFDKA